MKSTKELGGRFFLDVAPQISLETLLPLIGFSIFGLFVLIWCIALLYNGIKTAANAKGIKAIVIL